MRPELLAPAGSPEALRAAVQNGADAVYLGWGAFNARRGAKNFSDEEFAAALAGCSTVRSLWMPRIASSIPSKIVIKPKPPASTTPAFSSTGF